MKAPQIRLYEKRSDVVLYGYIHDRPAPSGPRPAIVICPGGGLHSVSRGGSEGDDVALSFFSDGYNAFVLEYSVLSKAPEGCAALPYAALDLARALSLIRSEASSLDVDASRIAVAGFSAGGWVASLYATCIGEPWMREGLGCDPVMPCAQLLIYSVLDADVFRSHMPEADALALYGSRNPTDAQWRAFSPVHHVNERTPPTFIAASLDDSAVDPEQSIRFLQRLREFGVAAELHLFELGNHAYGAARSIEEPWRDDKALSCGAWLPLAKTFLMHALAPETRVGQRTSFGS